MYGGGSGETTAGNTSKRKTRRVLRKQPETDTLQHHQSVPIPPAPVGVAVGDVVM